MRRVALALAALAAGCLSHHHGREAAGTTGQVLSAPAIRLDPFARVRRACGEPATRLDDPPLRRMPYLQSVTDRSAVVLFTAEPGRYRLSLTDPRTGERREAPATLVATPILEHVQQYAVELHGLGAATDYCYAIHDARGLVHGPIGFRTAPDHEDAEVSFIVFGDSGSGHRDQYRVAEQFGTVPLDLILHTGDLAYFSGRLDQLEDRFFAVYEPWLASFPVFPAIGNHDYHTLDGAPFREAFELPRTGGVEGRERYYAFDWGPVHFVALDTEVAHPHQSAWLERDLVRNTRPWVVVYAHRGPFSSGEHGASARFRREFHPILARHRVPLVFTGHDHHYERTRTIDGVQYVVTGGGGASTRSVRPTRHTAFAESVLHFVWVRIEGDRAELHAIDATGREFDGTQLVRRPAMPETTASAIASAAATP